MCALREPFGDNGRIGMYASLFIIIIILGFIKYHYGCYYYLLLLFIILYSASLSKKKKEKDCTIYDVEIVCLTMEIQVSLIEPKYEQQVSRP